MHVMDEPFDDFASRVQVNEHDSLDSRWRGVSEIRLKSVRYRRIMLTSNPGYVVGADPEVQCPVLSVHALQKRSFAGTIGDGPRPPDCDLRGVRVEIHFRAVPLAISYRCIKPDRPERLRPVDRLTVDHRPGDRLDLD